MRKTTLYNSAVLSAFALALVGCKSAVAEGPPASAGVAAPPATTASAPQSAVAEGPPASAGVAAPPATTASAPQPTRPDAETAADARELTEFSSRTLGISFRYPTKVFEAPPKDGTVVTLDSGFWVDEPHGLTEHTQDTKQHFRGTFELRGQSAEASLALDSKSHHENVFERGSFTAQKDYAEPRTIAGKPGFVILWGAHGYDQRDYYVELSKGRTLVVRFGVVGDVVQTRKKGVPEAQQVSIIEGIVSSIRQ